MEEIRIGYLGLLIANVILGFLFGTFPLVAGLLSGNRKYAFLGFVITLAGGAMLGIFLSFPIAMLFFWLILRRPAVETSDQEVTTPVTKVEPGTV